MADEWKARPDRPVDVPLLRLELGEQFERLKQESTWRRSGRNAITVTKAPGLRVVLLLLGRGARLSEHQAAGPLTFQVLGGWVNFRAGGRVERLGPGALIALESAVAHDVEALEESACVLTLGGGSHETEGTDHAGRVQDR
jgi:quercetin dioxygenase-like cupin family protein